MRRFAVLFAVVLVVVLAGCGGLIGDDTADGVESAAANGDIEFPDGYDEQGLADIDAAADAHDTAAGAADALDVWIETSQSGEQSFTVEQRQQVDRTRGVALADRSSNGNERQSYQTEDGTVYVRDAGPDSVRYRVEEERLDDFVPDVRNFLALFEGVTLQHEQTEHEGTAVIAYELDGDATTTIDGETFDLNEASIVVDEQGRIHALSVTALSDGTEQSISVEFAYGPVAIEEPNWLEDAKDATDEEF